MNFASFEDANSPEQTVRKPVDDPGVANSSLARNSPVKPTAAARCHLAVDLRARAPDLTQIPPLNIPRAGVCFVDRKLGRHTDSSAQA